MELFGNILNNEYYITEFFVDYFNNLIRLGTIGVNRCYDNSDYIGMSKSNAMDIADEELLKIDMNLLLSSNSFMDWFNNTCKYSVLYHSIYIYLHKKNIDMNNLVLNWFREYYFTQITIYHLK